MVVVAPDTDDRAITLAWPARRPVICPVVTSSLTTLLSAG
jgi:hypothetical protein